MPTAKPPLASTAALISTGATTTRTPGYWKNWSRCTGGKQVETATKNGGPAAGFYLLDDHLPHTLWTNSGGMTGCQSFTISECALGVKVLSTQDRNGKQRASDAAYNLAKHLMAYQLKSSLTRRLARPPPVLRPVPKRCWPVFASMPARNT